jgi:pimeloyl-ACP methyl ester carboxylesterase
MNSTRSPVVFIHGLWLHTTSWAPWLDLIEFADRGHSLTIDHGWREIAGARLGRLAERGL